MVELILIALLVGWLTGGKFWRLADAHIREGWLIFLAIALYVGMAVVRRLMGLTHFEWLFGATQVMEKLALLVLVIRNLRIPGSKLILIGMILNFIAIVANHGIMPARPECISAAYGPKYLAQAKAEPHVYSGIMDATCELGFLCDVIAARRPFVAIPGVYSVGDVILIIGIFIAIIGIMRTPLPKEKVVAREA